MSAEQPIPLALRAAAPGVLPELPSDAGLSWRPLTRTDVPGWLALMAAAEDADDALERTAANELDERFAGSWRDPARDTIGGFDASGTMKASGFASFRPADSGTLAPILFGTVHPEFRGRGIGRALLGWLEGRARQQLAATEADLPARLRVYVDEHHHSARQLAVLAGFAELRWFSILRRDLSVPLPDVTVATGFSVRTYTSDLAEAVRVTHNDAFARDHWGSSPYAAEVWSLEVIGQDKFRPDWSFVAVDDATGTVVGYLLSGAYDQDWSHQGYTEGWTDIIAVRREARGRGLAAALLAIAMAAYARDGMEYAGLDVDTENPTGALGLYTRLGYERVAGSVLYAKDI